MPKTRLIIELGYNTREEVENGVWETSVTWVKAKASEQRIYQRRTDQALKDGLPLTKRFQVRGHHITQRGLDYVKVDGVTYKVRSVTVDTSSHYAIIETREQL